MVSCIAGFALGYLIGSLPTAYLLSRWVLSVDILSSGSGNAGARNVYDVSGSVGLAVAVFAIDCLKGTAAVLAAGAIPGGGFPAAASGGVGSVLGHNFPLWTRFRGGRGLATGVGVLGTLCWTAVILWCAAWIAVYFAGHRNLHRSNIVACVVMPIGMLLLPGRPVAGFSPGLPWQDGSAAAAAGVSVCVLLRHREFLHPTSLQKTQ